MVAELVEAHTPVSGTVSGRGVSSPQIAVEEVSLILRSNEKVGLLCGSICEL